MPTCHCIKCGEATCHNPCAAGLRCAVCTTVRLAPKLLSKPTKTKKEKITKMSAKERKKARKGK